MKLLLMSVSFLLIAVIGNGQLSSPWVKPVPPGKLKGTDSLLLKKQNGVLASGIPAFFSHKTSQGAIYQLSPDRMPCLVPTPGTSAPMPVLKLSQKDSMNRWIWR